MLRRVAVIGAGTSGLYTSKYLLHHLSPNIQIDIFDKRKKIGGILPGAVAPDHREVAAAPCAEFSQWLRTNHQFARFIGEQEVGAAQLLDMRRNYEAVILATGCDKPRKLGIPGQTLKNILAGVTMAHLFNGQETPEIKLPVSNLLIVGGGNVALDVARVMSLATLGKVHCPPLGILKGGLLSTTIILRRSLLDAACSTVELRELIETPGVNVTVDEGSLKEVAAIAPKSRRERKLHTLHG